MPRGRWALAATSTAMKNERLARAARAITHARPLPAAFYTIPRKQNQTRRVRFGSVLSSPPMVWN